MTKQWTVQQALNQIEQGNSVCAAIREGMIIATETGRGVAPILNLYHQGSLTGSFLVDKVVGKAAAMVMTRGRIAGCHAITVSRAALNWFQKQGVPITYDHLADYIVNRTGDGMCPMEQTVLELEEDGNIVSVLEETLAKFRNQTK